MDWRLTLFIFTLIIFPGLAREPNVALSLELMKEGQKMIDLISVARRCEVKNNDKGKDGLSLCTGVHLNSNDLNFLKSADINQCKQFLKQMNYKVFEVDAKNRPKEVPEDDYRHFFSSTKLALILHRERVVLFKNEAKRGDCLHEIIHFYQRHRDSTNALSPLNRKDRERIMQVLLEREVLKVEKIEKEGKKELAQKYANYLGHYITLQKEWQNLMHWLDEKEVYQIYYDFGELVGSSDRDIDVALSNLIRLKEYLPWGLKERVLYDAQEELNKKYQQVKVPAIKPALSEAEYNSLYEKGEISREKFEKEVIGLRKFNAKKALENKDAIFSVGGLLNKLENLGKMRDFKKEGPIQAEAKVKWSLFHLPNFRYLPLLKISSKSLKEKKNYYLVVDLGAQESLLDPYFFEGFKDLSFSAFSLVGSKTLLAPTRQSFVSPIIQFHDSLELIGKEATMLNVKGLTFSLGRLDDLGLGALNAEAENGQIIGVLGIDFFSKFPHKKWEWDFDTKTLSNREEVKNQLKYPLAGNGRGVFDAIEFHCPGEKPLKVRVDTGSEIFGDVFVGLDGRPYFKGRTDLKKRKKMVYSQLKDCIGKSVPIKKNAFHYFTELSPLFSRDVTVNIGLPFMNQLKAMTFELDKGLIGFSAK